MTGKGQEQQVRFYRRWSSLAAAQALAATEPRAKRRCTDCANIWSRIADAIEADDHSLQRITSNLICLTV